ncbi:MAG: amidohydrolase family protein [Candidatus Acidiferrales bacterium]
MKRIVFILLAGIACALPLRAQSPEGAGVSLVFTHVTIIDTATGALHPDNYVIVSGNRIEQVGKKHHVKIPKDGKVIDGTGKFMIPGLWDMHVHTFFDDRGKAGRDVTLPLFIANGVTGVRDMGSDLEPVLLARKEIGEHRLLGPRMIVAGPMLDGPKSTYRSAIAIATPEDGRRAVDMLKARGVDFIKIQSYVPRDAYFAIVDECKKQNIIFVGHVPDAIRALEASNAGQKSFEHLIGIFEASSTVENELLKGPKSPGRFLDTYDPAREAAIIQLLKKNNTWQCPTLFWERGQWLVDVIDPNKDPDIKYAPVSWRDKAWPRATQSIIKEMDTDPLPVREKFVQHELDIVKKLNQAGVPFLAGTDCPAGVDVLPGFSLHLELQRFIAAGFTPLQALQTATINPATFLEKQSDFGAVEPGKVADLLLLDANPLDDIRNTQKIDAVVADGRYFSRADLDRILRDVQAAASKR